MSQCRLAQANDIAALFAIEKLAGFNHWSLAQIEESLENHDVYVLIKDNIIAGYAVFQAVFAEVELLNIVISPEFQRLKLATQLLTFTLNHYCEKACERCFLEVGVNNAGALNLYKKLGFQQVAIRKNYYQRMNITEDAMVMQLLFGESLCKN